MYKNFCIQRQIDADDDGEKKAINYRLMSDEEIPSWFVDAVYL